MPDDRNQQKNAQYSDAEAAPEQNEQILKNLYIKSVEILNKNKTLSLLSKLYEISILTLEPIDLARKICSSIQEELSFELVGIFQFDSKKKSLHPLAFAQSKRLSDILSLEKFRFEDIQVYDIGRNEFFRDLTLGKNEKITDNSEEVWCSLIDPYTFNNVFKKSNIHTTIAYPLAVEDKMLGLIVLALNRDFESLSPFEKESITSLKNVVALALEKALLYKDLEDANEQLRELDRQKDELLSIVSHQLATPVSSVKWYVEMLLAGDLGQITAEQKEHLSIMQSVTSNLSDLVSMILDVSRIQLGRMKLDPQELDLNEFFKEILDIITPKAKEKGVDFDVHVPSNLPKAKLDKRYTHMTIENLLSNAIKYTPEKGTVEFNVKIENGTLYCSVRDTGCGIPKADQDKIFGKLFRASNVRNTVDGNGFGLYVAKGAVESQGGKISFKSTEGKGTTFFVELPLRRD